jgi:hypothetical protein
MSQRIFSARAPPASLMLPAIMQAPSIRIIQTSVEVPLNVIVSPSGSGHSPVWSYNPGGRNPIVAMAGPGARAFPPVKSQVAAFTDWTSPRTSSALDTGVGRNPDPLSFPIRAPSPVVTAPPSNLQPFILIFAPIETSPPAYTLPVIET